MKRFVILFMLMSLLIPNLAQASEKETEPYRVVGVIINSTTMVPVRDLFDNLGATITWDDKTQTVTAIKDGTNITLVIGSSSADVNGKRVKLDQPAVNVENKTVVPLRFVSETLGYKVKWNQSNQTVSVGEQFIVSVRSSFSAPLAVFKQNNKYGFIGNTGNIVIEPQFDYAYDFSEGLAIVQINKQYGYIDIAGNVVIEPQFESARGFSEGLAAVRINGKYGFINKMGEVIISPQFYDVKNFSEGLCSYYTQGEGTGLIDTSGHIVLDHTKYVTIDEFSNGIAGVTYGNGRTIFGVGEHAGFIKKNGELISDEDKYRMFKFKKGDEYERGVYDEVKYLGKFIDGYTIATFGYMPGYYSEGIVDKNYNVVIGPIRAFDHINPGTLSDGLFVAFDRNGDAGYYDFNRKLIIDCNKLGIVVGNPFYKGLATVQLQHDVFAIMNKKGTIIKRFNDLQKLGKLVNPNNTNEVVFG